MAATVAKLEFLLFLLQRLHRIHQEAVLIDWLCFISRVWKDRVIFAEAKEKCRGSTFKALSWLSDGMAFRYK